MNEIMEMLNGLGGNVTLVAGGGVVGLLAIFFFLKKKKGSKKVNGGGYDYGDSTTAGYDTKAGNFVDELNSDSVLTKDVQDFAVPNFDKDELERSTISRGYKKKKVFNSSIPGMTLGDTRPMIPLAEDDINESLDLRSEIKNTQRTAVSGFGLKPKAIGGVNTVDIATITTSGLKVLDDVEQLMRPAAPEKVSADSPVQSINVPMSMKIADVDDIYKKEAEKEIELNFMGIPDFPGTSSKSAENESNSSDAHEFELSPFPSVNTKLEMKLEDPKETYDEFSSTANSQVAEGLSFFSMDSDNTTEEKPVNDEIDLSDIPGLKLDEVDNAAQYSAAIPHVVEEEPEFITVSTRLNEADFPETVAYHQEINTALFLDDEGMKEQALQTLQNTVELISNIKVKFYFKLAIQSYVNNTKEKALADIIKNFYDFEFEKYSKN